MEKARKREKELGADVEYILQYCKHFGNGILEG
jgi:hypothetical protein